MQHAIQTQLLKVINSNSWQDLRVPYHPGSLHFRMASFETGNRLRLHLHHHHRRRYRRKGSRRL